MLYFLTFLLISISTSNNTHANNLESIISKAINQHQEIKKIKHQINQYKAQRIGSYGKFFPNLYLNQNKAKTENEISNQNEKTTVKIKEIILQQNIFNGGKDLNQITIDNLQIKFLQQKLIEKKTNINYQIYNILSQIFYLKKKLSNLQTQHKTASQLLSLETLNFRNLEANNFDITKSKITQLNTQSQISQSQNEINIKLLDLKLLTDLDITILNYSPSPLPQFLEYQKNYHKLLKNNLSLKMINIQLQINRKTHLQNKQNILPSADIEGKISKESNLFFYQNNNVKKKSLAVNIRVPILSSLKNYSKIKQSSQNILLSEKNYKIRESKLSKELFLLIKKFNQLQNQIINIEYITNLLTKQLFLTKKEQQLTEYSEIKFLNAKLQVKQQEIQKFEQLRKLHILYFQIMAITGKQTKT
jgi:outer membrane protein TolC